MKPGDLVTYEISQENYKTKQATVKISDTLDPNVELVEDQTTPGFRKSGRTLTWELPTAAGDAAKVILVVRVLDSALEVYRIGNQAKASVGINNVYDTDQWTNEEENPLTEPPVKTLGNCLVNVSMTMTFYETAYGADNLDGLIIVEPENTAAEGEAG